MKNDTNIATSTVGLIIVLGVIWGGAFTIIKVLVDDLTPIEMAAGRLALGALAVIVYLRLRGDLSAPPRGLLLPIAAVAMLDTLIPYTLVGWAQSRIDSSTAAVLISAMPLFTVIFAAATMREESVGRVQVAGIALGFAGVLTLVGGPRVIVEGGSAGQFAVVGAAASYAIGALYARKLLRRVDAATLTATKLSAGALLASVAVAARGDGAGFVALNAADAAALVTLGVVCTGLTFVLYFRLVVAAGSVGASTVTYVIPVFGVLFGVVLLGESLNAAMLGGMALIIAGVATVMYGPMLQSTVTARFAHPHPHVGAPAALR